jgi:DNA-directed RNA polymerase alpha subunit
MPDGNTDYSYRHPKLKPIYTVKVAPENVLHGPISELPKYVQSLKDFGIKADFEYNFNFAAKKRTRFLEKNRELIAINISPRVLNVLNDMDIFTVKALRKITVKKLRSMKGIGNTTIQEFLSALEKQNIFLQEDQESYV